MHGKSCNFLSIFVHLGTVSVHFDQEHGGRIVGQSGMAEILDGADGEVVQKLQGGRDDVLRDDRGDRFRCLIHLIEYRQQGFARGRQRNQFQNNLVQHPQGAFRTDHQGFEIISCCTFDRARSGFDPPPSASKNCRPIT